MFGDPNDRSLCMRAAKAVVAVWIEQDTSTTQEDDIGKDGPTEDFEKRHSAGARTVELLVVEQQAEPPADCTDAPGVGEVLLLGHDVVAEVSEIDFDCFLHDSRRESRQMSESAGVLVHDGAEEEAVAGELESSAFVVIL